MMSVAKMKPFVYFVLEAAVVTVAVAIFLVALGALAWSLLVFLFG